MADYPYEFAATTPLIVSSSLNADYTITTDATTKLRGKIIAILPEDSWTGKAEYAILGGTAWNTATGLEAGAAESHVQIMWGPFKRVITTSGKARLIMEN